MKYGTIEDMEQHPLNQAARERIERVLGNPRVISLLTLAGGYLESEPDQPDNLRVADFASQLPTQRKALRILEADLTVEDVESLPLPELSKLIAELLEPPPPADWW